MSDKSDFLKLIKSNVDKFGYHITIVIEAVEPRYAYTIGLKESLGFELIFAGGILFLKDELYSIFNNVVEELKINNELSKVSIGALGTFSLVKVNPSWNKLMTLGVFDYYKTEEIKTYQIIPDSEHHTLDIPDMSKKFDISTEPVWQWLNREWDYSVPPKSTVTINIQVLRGEKITELMRWEIDEWEAFSRKGSEVDEKDVRVVSLGTVLGVDETILPAVNLKVGAGLWREHESSEWNSWGSGSN
jgi:hypothetical protein